MADTDITVAITTISNNGRWYIARYKSDGNAASEQSVLIGKYSKLEDAQSAFFDWLSKQPVYKHLWNLQVSFSYLDDSMV